MLATVSLGLLLRLKNLVNKDIWYDEALTIIQSQKSLTLILNDVPTPVHYFITHLFTIFSTNILFLRIPSIFVGTLSIYLLFLVTSMISTRRVAIISSFLLAVSPIHIEFSQQILFFSYYVFFSLLSLYFLLLFTKSLTKKPNLFYLLIFMIIAVTNILNIMLALVVTAIQFGYLIIRLLSPKQRNPKAILVFTVIGILSALAIYSIPGYKNFFNNLLHFDFNKPITLGYSLSHRLNNINLQPTAEFFYLMFSWFGFGYGWRFYPPFLFFLLGISIFFLNRQKREHLPLLLMWIFLPFILLFIFKLDHWFEEKYFIFIVPVYLLVIAQGVDLFSKILVKVPSLTKYVLILFLLLSLGSLKNLTSFGYTFDGHVGYDWNIVHRYLAEILKPGDKVILPKEGTLFLEIYFGKDSEKYILDETEIAKLSAEEYNNLVNSDAKIYFVSIPSFEYLYLYPTAMSEHLAVMGNFNIYKLKFQKYSPPPITSTYKQWSYYDDFRTGSYLSHSSSWENFISSYVLSTGTTLEGANMLHPISLNSSALTYRFQIPLGSTNIKLKPIFQLGPNRKFQVYVGADEKKPTLVYEQATKATDLYSPNIDLSWLNRSLSVTVKFVFTDVAFGTNDDSYFKLVSLSGERADLPAKPAYETIRDTNNVPAYVYNSELEAIKSPKWFYDTTQNKGWFQTNEGFLVNYLGVDKNPLIYHLSFDQHIDMMELQVKASNHYTNPMESYYSVDGINWKHLNTIDRNMPFIYTSNIANLDSRDLYLKFTTLLPGPSSQIRNIIVKAKIKSI